MVSRQKEGHAIWWLPPSIVSLETKTEQKNKNAVWFKNFHATLQFLSPDDILFQQIIYTNLRNMNAWRKIKWIQLLGLNGFCLLVFVSLCSRREDKLRIPSGWLCHLAPEIVCQLSPETAEDQLPFSKQSDVFAFGWVHFSTRDAEKHVFDAQISVGLQLEPRDYQWEFMCPCVVHSWEIFGCKWGAIKNS